jgi:hypothetical protein
VFIRDGYSSITANPAARARQYIGMMYTVENMAMLAGIRQNTGF